MGFNFSQVFQSVQHSLPAAQSGFETFSASAGNTLCKTYAHASSEFEKFKPVVADATQELQKFGDASVKTLRPMAERDYAQVSTELEKYAPVAAGAAAAVIGFAATPVIAAPALGLVGFSSVGPVAGSIAAGIQGSIGSVAAGSPFAVAQSIAMGGVVGVGSMIVGGVIGGITVFVAVVLLRRAMRRWKARRARNAITAGDKNKLNC